MQWKQWIVTSVMVVTLAFVGCGDKGSDSGGGGGGAGPAGGSDAAPKAAPVPSELAALVPTNAMALVYVKAPGELEGKVKELMGQIDPEMAEQVQLEAMVGQMLMGAGQHWDPSKPMAIAVPLPGPEQDMEEAFEGVAMIFGMKDAEAAKAEMEKAFEKQMEGVPEKYRPKPEDRPQFMVSGNYLTMSRGAAGKRGGASIAATAPEGDLALRIDLAAIVGRFRKDIDEGLKEMESGLDENLDRMPPGMESLGGMFETLAGFAKDFVNSAETLDISASIDGGSVELAFGFVAKQGSALDKPGHDHSGLAALAAHLPADLPINLLMSLDIGSMMEWLKPLMEAGMEDMPEDARAKYAQYIAESTEMSKLLGPNWALGMTMSDKGMHMVQVADSKDAKTYIERAGKLFSDDMIGGIPGFDAKKGEITKIAGIDVHAYQLSFDLEAMMKLQDPNAKMPPEMLSKMNGFMETLFGKDGMTMHMAAVQGKLLFTMGGTERMAAAIESVSKGGGKAPPALQKGLDKTGGKPTFLLNVDVREIVKQIMPLVADIADEEMPAVPAGAPIPIMVWGKHDGRVYGGGLQVDVGGIVQMVKAMEGDEK
ncbi:MAG: hypothetical protein QNJ90_06505 [Planctomycetota bacterium]|nr:hypothetical protein [Planctomycetota bacterium]